MSNMLLNYPKLKAGVKLQSCPLTGRKVALLGQLSYSATAVAFAHQLCGEVRLLLIAR